MSQLTEQYRDLDYPPWMMHADFVFRFWVSPNRCLGLQYYSLLATEYVVDEERLSLAFPAGTVIIIGPQTSLLYDSFCKERGRATMVKADGMGITSITFQIREKKE